MGAASRWTCWRSSSSPVARSAPVRIRRRGSASSCSPSCRPARCSTSGAARACSPSRGRSSASRRCSAVDHDPVAVETTIANAAANGVEVDARVADALSGELPDAGTTVANLTLEAVRELAPRVRSQCLVTSGYLATDELLLPGRKRPSPSHARRLGRGRLGARRGVTFRPMATFSVGFLGCKVSHVDAHAVRERLLADGHSEQAGRRRRRRRQHVLRDARGGLEVAQGRLSPRTHARPRLRHRLRGESSGERVRRARRQRRRRREAERGDARSAMAGDVGAIACVQAEARLDRIRAFVKVQDGCSFSCAFCVIPHVRGASRSRPADGVLREIARRVEQGHREVVLTGINLGCYRDRAAGYDLPRLVREAGSTPGLARLQALLDRGEPRERGARGGASRHAHRRTAPAHPAAVRRRSDPRGNGAALRRRRRSCAGPASPTASTSRPTSSSAFPARTRRPSATRCRWSPRPG